MENDDIYLATPHCLGVHLSPSVSPTYSPQAVLAQVKKEEVHPLLSQAELNI